MKSVLTLFLLISCSAAASDAPRININKKPEALSLYDSAAMTQLKFRSDPAVAALEATYYRNLYNALVKKGFSKNEALQIVIGVATRN